MMLTYIVRLAAYLVVFQGISVCQDGAGLLQDADRRVLLAHKASLEALEKSRAAGGDYVGAERVKTVLDAFLQKEMQGLAAAPEPVKSLPPGASPGVAPATAKPILLLSTGSNCSEIGATQLDKEAGGVILAAKGAGLRWASLAVQPGFYEVSLVCSVDNVTQRQVFDRKLGYHTSAEVAWGGAVAFREASNLKTSGEITGGVKPDPAAQPGQREHSLNLGVVEFFNNRVDVELLATKAANKPDSLGGVCVVRSLQLTPVSRPAAGATGAIPVPPAVTAALEKYNQATAGLNEKWYAMLGEMVAAGGSSVDPPILAEFERLKPLFAVAGSPTPTATTPAAVAGASSEKATGKVVLSLLDRLSVTIGGDMRLASGGEFYEKLRPKGAKLTVKLAEGRVAPGRYRVKLHTRMNDRSGGTYQLKLGSAVLDGIITLGNSLDGNGRTYMPDGALTVPVGQSYLEFIVGEVAGRDGSLCDIKAIELIPEQ